MRRERILREPAMREPATGGSRASSGHPRMLAMAPNILTLLGLCAGVTAIRFALEQNWSLALESLTFAAIFDMLDGRMARWLGTSSDFGAQLDSLADLVSFGVAPPVIVYVWALSSSPAGWPLALLFSASCAARLARFNCERSPDPLDRPHRYFTGLPAPGAAGLALLPLMLSLQSGNALFQSPVFNICTLGVVSALMISRLPTLSLKHISVEGAKGPALALAALGVLVAAFRWPWTLAAAGWAAYALTIPLNVFTFAARRSARRMQARRTQSRPIQTGRIRRG